MNRAQAWALLVIMAAASAAALVAPLGILILLVALGVAGLRRRGAFLLFAGVSVAINVAILAYVDRDEGWLRGLTGGLRLAAALAANLALLARFDVARILEGLRLPSRVTALVAAILLAAQDVSRDLARLRDARRLDGAWPASRLARARETARLLPPLLVAAHARAQTRREALALAGHAFPPGFVPLVAVAALCAAGRLAFLALPNVALTYVLAFLGGHLFGARVGALGAFLGMALTDLLLTGLYPGGFVNAPAMALLALVGALLRRVDVTRALAAAIGILGTLLFSVATDSFTWLLLYAAEPAAWAPMILAGLVFNVVPALVNAALFAASVTPTVRAFRAWQGRDPGASRPRQAASPVSPATPE